MRKRRLQVMLDEEEYREIQLCALGQRTTVSEWVRQALRSARDNQPRSSEAKLRAIADAYSHQFPTADIDDMLREIEAGRNLR